MTTLVPDKSALRRYLSAGLTQAEIVDQWETDSGVKVSRSAIGMAIERYGLQSANPRRRHGELIPWRVSRVHNNKMDLIMLRAEARRRSGEKLTPRTERLLDSWLGRLEDADAVIHYDADTVEGFWWVTKQDGDTDIIRIPAQRDRRAS